jgi:hypothetical protein
VNIEYFSLCILLSAVLSLLGQGVLVNNPILHAQSVNSTILSDKIGVKIAFPKANSTVPVGTLTINGTSSDTSQTDCRVYVDWNDLKPMQNVTAAGINGTNDYSSWKFTYDQKYHTIVQGTNELTSKIICTNNLSGNTTKFYSINVTGTMSNSSSLSSLTPDIPAALNQTETNSSGYHTISYQGILPQYDRAIIKEDEESTANNNESEDNENTQQDVSSKIDKSSSGKEDNEDKSVTENTNEESKIVGSSKENYPHALTVPYEKVNKRVEEINYEEITNDYELNNVKNNFESDNDEEKHKDTKTSKLDKIKKKFQKSILKKTALYDSSELEKSIKSAIKKRLGKIGQNLLN